MPLEITVDEIQMEVASLYLEKRVLQRQLAAAHGAIERLRSANQLLSEANRKLTAGGKSHPTDTPTMTATGESAD